MRRVSVEEFYARGLPETEPFWYDQVLFDIPATVLAAVKSAYARGARAVTCHEIVVHSHKYKKVLDALKERGMKLYVTREPDYKRREWAL